MATQNLRGTLACYQLASWRQPAALEASLRCSRARPCKQQSCALHARAVGIGAPWDAAQTETHGNARYAEITKKNADNSMRIAKPIGGMDQRAIGLRHVFLQYEIAGKVWPGAWRILARHHPHLAHVGFPLAGAAAFAAALAGGAAFTPLARSPAIAP